MICLVPYKVLGRRHEQGISAARSGYFLTSLPCYCFLLPRLTHHTSDVVDARIPPFLAGCSRFNKFGTMSLMTQESSLNFQRERQQGTRAGG